MEPLDHDASHKEVYGGPLGAAMASAQTNPVDVIADLLGEEAVKGVVRITSETLSAGDSSRATFSCVRSRSGSLSNQL